MASFLGKTERKLQCGRLNDEDIENADETHFIINFDDGKSLGFRGNVNVQHADATPGGEGMNMMVHSWWRKAIYRKSVPYI